MIKSNFAPLVLLLSILIFSCNREEPQDSNITMNPAELEIDYQETFQLEAIFNRDGYNPSDFIWETSNENIISLGRNGMITGERAGTATVTVLSNDRQFSATSVVTVNPTNFLYQEPLFDFRENKAFIKANENRRLLDEEEEYLIFEGENINIHGVVYEFENSLYDLSVALLNLDSEDQLETLFEFLEQRYDIEGVYDEIVIFENEFVVVGLTIHESLGLIAIYIENDQPTGASARATKFGNLLDQEKLNSIKRESTSGSTLNLKKYMERFK